MTLTSSRRSQIRPFHVMEIVARAAVQEARTGDVLHLEVGQPSTGAPTTAVRRAIELLSAGDPLGYTAAGGVDQLRDRIARLYVDRHGVTVARERIVVTAGASAGCVLTILAAFDPGARVAVATPGYPCYEQIISSLGLDAVPVRVGDHNGYLLGPDDLDQAVRSGGPIDGVMVASPANPTGAVYDGARLEALVRWCAEHEVRLICDEIYHGITFGPPAPSATACDADVVVIGSFSKYFSMTGWRLGWLILPTSLVEPVDRLAQNLYLAPPTLAQHVALAAFDATDELDAHVTRYATNRTVLVDALAAIGLDHHAPCDGAFYLYTDVSRFGIDSADLVDTWLNDLGVAASPGIDFDHTDGGDWVRFSLAGSVADVTEAARRLVAWGHATLDGRRG